MVRIGGYHGQKTKRIEEVQLDGYVSIQQNLRDQFVRLFNFDVSSMTGNVRLCENGKLTDCSEQPHRQPRQQEASPRQAERPQGRGQRGQESHLVREK